MNRFWIFVIGIMLLIGACESSTGDAGEYDQRIVILYTNDEHGWMEEADNYGGAAKLMGLWRQEENYSESEPFLILSGGDMWTGPAISTWFEGESMVDVMNKMNYSAAAMGNHEFDFKISGLRERIAECEFPILSANIREKATGNGPDFAQPYMIIEVGGVNVGIVGLSSISTPYSTFPDHVIDYDFISYETALEEIMPSVKNDGAELIIVLGHICVNEMRALAQSAKNLGVSVIGGGHCHEQHAEMYNDIALIEGGYFMNGYAKLEILYNIKDNSVVKMTPSIHLNEGGTPDPEIADAVSYWKTQMDDTLSLTIGYASADIGRNTWEMYNMVCDSWFETFPGADISMTNAGGIRQDVPGGDITLATIVGLLPFENAILQLELNGQQIEDGIYNLIVGGMTTTNGFRLADGTPIHPDSVYIVLTTDYLYSRTDYNFQYDDPDPYHTAVHYRQPLIDWMESMNTSSVDPINNYLDSTPRR